MQITINTPSGGIITLEVDLSDTIATIKAKIQDREGIPSDRQQLFLAGNAGIPFENDRTIGDYNIPAGSTLNLVVVVDRKGSCCSII